MTRHFHLFSRLLFAFSTLYPMTLSAQDAIHLNSSNTVSVTTLVSTVLQANPQLKIAQATWQAAVATIKQQSALDDSHFQYRFAPLTIDSYKPNGQKSDFGQQFEISQLLPFPGKLHLRGLVAEYQAERQYQNITTLQLLLASSTKMLFADWYFIHQAISIHQQKQTLFADLTEVALSQYSTGSINQHAILKLKLELTLLDHQTIVLNRQQKTIQIQLNTLLNRPVHSPLPKPQALSSINSLPNFKDLQNKAMQARPELKAVNTDIKGYKAKTELAALAYYPDLKISAGYNSLWDNEDKRFNMGIGINIPLDQSKRQAAEQQANAYQQQAQWQKMDLEAKINQQLAQTYAHVEESLQVLKYYQQKRQPLAMDQVIAAKSAYQAGRSDILNLMRREKDQLDVQLKTQQALAEVHRQFAKLEQMSGSLEPFLANQ